MMATQQEFEQQILSCLNAVSGTAVSDIRGQTIYRNLPASSQAKIHTDALKRLESRGLVRRLDDKRPIAWMLPASN